MIYEKLAEIQKKLNAPKGQFNKFGGYSYRSCEDILEAVKPLLGDCVLTVSDDIALIGDRFYIKATARIALSKDDYVENTAYARESETMKGMAESQITGAASSYARKYALNGLFAIDDNKDADTMAPEQPEKKEPEKTKSPLLVKARQAVQKIRSVEAIDNALENAVYALNDELVKAGYEKESALLIAELNKKIAPIDDRI